MSSTREKILQNARELFNRHGAEEVTIRQIAKLLKISPGNLTYHFNSKKDIIAALVKRYMQKVTENGKDWDDGRMTMDQVATYFEERLRLQLEYRFFPLNYAHIITNDPELHGQVLHDFHESTSWYEHFFRQLCEHGLAEPDRLNPHRYRLRLQFQALTHNWIHESSVYFSHLDDEQNIRRSTALILSLLEPFATEEGKRQLAPYLKTAAQPAAPTEAVADRLTALKLRTDKGG